MATLLRGVRVLLPEWTMALVRPSKALEPNVAVFRVDPKFELRFLFNIDDCSVSRNETPLEDTIRLQGITTRYLSLFLEEFFVKSLNRYCFPTCALKVNNSFQNEQN